MLSINQPYFFPNIGYFSLIHQSVTHLFLDDVNMRKKSWITRNQFTESDDIFSLKVKNFSQNKKINEHFLIDIKNQLKTLQNMVLQDSYSAPGYNDVRYILNKIEKSLRDDMSVSDFNILCVTIVCKELNISSSLESTSRYGNPSGLKGYERLVELCRTFNSVSYLNLESGKDIYDPELFIERGVKLFFNDTSKLKLEIPENLYYKSILKLILELGKLRVAELLNFSRFQDK